MDLEKISCKQQKQVKTSKSKQSFTLSYNLLSAHHSHATCSTHLFTAYQASECVCYHLSCDPCYIFDHTSYLYVAQHCSQKALSLWPQESCSAHHLQWAKRTIDWTDRASICDCKSSSCPSKLGGKMLSHFLEFSRSIQIQCYILGLQFLQAIKQ